MADVKNAGYAASETTALSTDLNSDADDTWSALSSEYDNSTNGYMFMDIEVYLAAPSSAWSGGDSTYDIYVVPSMDGTNYPITTNSGTADEPENSRYYVGSISTEGASTVACRGVIRGVEVPPGKWKMFGRNRTNTALASSGNTVKWRPWGYEVV